MANLTKDWDQAISKVIKEQDVLVDLADGAALRHIMRTGQYMTSDMKNQLNEWLCSGFYNHIAVALEKAGREHITFAAWSELLNLRELDELAQELCEKVEDK